MSYVTFLCAQQVVDWVMSDHREFTREHRPAAAALDGLLSELPRLRRAVPLDDDPDRDAFLEWYESMFLATAAMPEVVE